jgi:hypothetical protein
VRIENVERILETMVAAGWVRRTVPSGWVLHRDAATITVEEVFGVFVFRGDAHRPGREADPALEALVHDIGARMSEITRISLTTLFVAADHKAELPLAGETGASPVNPGTT